MSHILTTATVGAQLTCAQETASSPALPGMGTIQKQHFFKPVYRRDLERSIRSLRRDLGFSTSEQAVLIALTSFLPCYDRGQERPIGPDLLLTIFASNEALCDRAGGIDDRTLRRCISRLEKAGWVIRRDSANGKRFARRAKGKLVAAFGIDISPLLQRSDDLIKRATRKVEMEEEKRSFIAEAKALIVECEKRSDLPARLDFKSLRASLRRVTTTFHHVKEMVQALKEHLTGLLCEASKTHQGTRTSTAEQACSISDENDHSQDTSVYRGDEEEVERTSDRPTKIEHTSKTDQKDVDPFTNKSSSHALCPTGHGHDTDVLPATDGQNARHKETLKPESKNMRVQQVEQASHTWDTCPELQAFFPQKPRSHHAVMRLLFDAGKLLRIGDALISEAVHRLPLSACMTILDEMMRQAAQIVSPDGYFKSMIAGGFKR